MTRVRVRSVAIVALLAVAAFGIGYGVSRAGRSTTATAPMPSRPSIPAPLVAATAAPSPGPSAPAAPAATADGVRRALARLAAAPGIGGRLLARVVDATTGAVLYDRAGSTPAAPASTAKLLTAAAILAVRPATYRFTTTVVGGGAGTVVLVGGGDPTLSPARPGTPTRYEGAARISDLADQMKKRHITVRHIVVDGSLFPGPSVAPSWDPADMGTNYGAPITAVVADAAQLGPEGSARSTQPDLAAGADLAAALGQPDLKVTRGTASDGAKTLATVRSAPLSELIPEMLLDSDNVIADILARQVAVAEHRPASFTGATAAIRIVLGRLGVPVGDGMKDGSGLSSADRVSPAALAAVLRLIGGAGPPAAARLRFVAGAMPVAGWSGTLEARFTSGSERSVAGRVRAKTGTLSTVSSLAGLVQDRSGRLLAFSFDADRAVGTVEAEAALDALVSALGHCGCR
jgi:D-alanyl-D-alanine carboxypeptidase/D-alanyl-D-alanine-endopeptidase (penicillin-binding protein 4)